MDEARARRLALNMILAARERLRDDEPRHFAFALAGMAGMTAIMRAEAGGSVVSAEWYEATRLIDERYMRSRSW